MNATATDLLYLLCSFSLVVSAGYVLFGRQRDNGSAANGHSTSRWFVLLAVSLLAWVATLYIFDRYQVFQLSADAVLLVGRANFASVAVAVYFALRFVLSLSDKNIDEAPVRSRFLHLLLWESVLMALISLCTGFVGRMETITAVVSPEEVTVFLSRPMTTYGALFPLYVLHVIAYLTAAVSVALSARKEALRPRRDQLGLVAVGMVTTGGIALVTNAALPYFLGNFRYTDVGTLSTLFFLVAVGWAVARHRLFNLRSFLRKTLVYGVLLALVAAVYSAVVLTLTVRLSEGRTSSLTQIVVIVLAGVFDPLKRFLDDKVDRLLFKGGGKR